ncbi:MAG: hypothetical protein J0I09_03660 [Sphingobacteriia bacterium]|nr:hypothetical protein [Sphingobacteriia bacterium]
MLPLQIRCYHPAAVQPPFTFYILSKGNNAGQPSFNPWVNCFVARCSNQQAFEFYYWLCYGLHQAGKFRVHHRGSVIQFINIAGVQSVVSSISPYMLQHWQKYQTVLQSLSKLEQLKTNLHQQIATTQKLQQALIHSYFNQAQ